MSEKATEAAAVAIWEIGAADDIDRLAADHYAEVAIRAYNAAMEESGFVWTQKPDELTDAIDLSEPIYVRKGDWSVDWGEERLDPRFAARPRAEGE